MPDFVDMKAVQRELTQYLKNNMDLKIYNYYSVHCSDSAYDMYNQLKTIQNLCVKN